MRAKTNNLDLATLLIASKAASNPSKEAATLLLKGKGKAKAPTAEDDKESSIEKEEAKDSSDNISDSDISDPSDFKGSGEEDLESFNACKDAKRHRRRIEDKKQAAIMHNIGIANYIANRKHQQPPQPRLI
jgi:hypothetical protein